MGVDGTSVLQRAKTLNIQKHATCRLHVDLHPISKSDRTAHQLEPNLNNTLKRVAPTDLKFRLNLKSARPENVIGLHLFEIVLS